MRIKPMRLARGCAVGNLCFAGLGFLLLFGTACQVRTARATILTPEQTNVFWVMTSIDLLLLVALVGSAALLWNMRPLGLWASITTYLLEIFYLPAISVLKITLRSSGTETRMKLADSVAAVLGIGNAALAPQLVTLYLIIAIILVSLAFRGRIETKANQTEFMTPTAGSPG